MKILYTIAGFYRAAGMERVLAGKARWLTEHGCEVVIVTTEQRGRPAVFEVPEEVRFVDLGVGYEDNNGASVWAKIFGLPLKKMRHRRALKALLAEEKPDVAVSMFCGDEGFLPRIASCMTVLECHFTRRKRVLYGRRGLWAMADRIRSGREPRKALAFDHFVVLTEEDRGYWLADCPSLERNIRVIPNARTFEPGEIAALRGSDAVGGVVLAAGRYSYQKHPEALVEAWGMIPEPEREGWTLRIAGDGELRPVLEAMDVSGVVLGPASDMKKEYASASVFALSSRYEGLPMVLLEAQSAGLPVVSFACKCGPRDVLTDGVDGFLVPEGNVAALAERLRALIKDPGLRAEMGRRALENSEKYREDNIMKTWTELFGVSGEGGQKTVVVSAVSLRKGGTLRILQQTLEYLSGRSDVRVTALVHDRKLCEYPEIEYIEIPWATRSWAHRLWCEYVTMHRISEDLARNGGPVDLWLSLHDTTPRVVAKEQEVYCHTSFPFLKLRLRDFMMDPKIPAFRLLTPLYYKVGARKNSSIIVQQEWFADALSRLMRVPREKFRVIPPAGAPEVGDMSPQKIFFNPDSPRELATRIGELVQDGARSFFFASTPDCHKNFETFLEAVRLLDSQDCEGLGIDPSDLRFVITVRGDENRYARWLHRRWGALPNVDFHGLMGRDELYEHYRKADCFVFPSRVETWGLPISEYASVHPDGILLLADLPYARGH